MRYLASLGLASSSSARLPTALRETPAGGVAPAQGAVAGRRGVGG